MSDAATSNVARSGPVRANARRWALIVAAISLACFLCLGVVLEAHPRTTFDDAVRHWVVQANSPGVTSLFSLVSTVGSVNPMIAYAVITIGLVALIRRSMTPLAILFAPAAVIFAYLGTKQVFMRTRPSGIGNALEGTYSFPSAHATTSSAVCCTLAYLLYREGIMSGVAASMAAALICLLVGMSRVYLDVHWTTDVIGGWCLGIAIAATAAALYETAGGATSTRLAGHAR